MGRTAGSTSSTDPAIPVLVGYVAGAHGLRGQIRVRCSAGTAQDPADLLGLESLTLAAGEADPRARRYAVSQIAAGRPGELRVALDGVAGRDAAQALRGLQVFADAGQLEPTGEDEYYAYQLVGCGVWAEDGREIGSVRSIWSTGAADLLVVGTPGGGEQLIPAVRELLKEVDVELRRIVVAPLPGLLDTPPPGGDGAGD